MDKQTSVHEWDSAGERCIKCGDKDWMNDPICNERYVKASSRTSQLPKKIILTSTPTQEGTPFK